MKETQNLKQMFDYARYSGHSKILRMAEESKNRAEAGYELADSELSELFAAKGEFILNTEDDKREP